MGAGKSKLDNASMRIDFEGGNRNFDGNNPIVGTIHVDASQPIPAYGISVKLELIDSSKEVDYGDKGQRYPHIWKRRVWERVIMIHQFNNCMVPLGQSSYPFSFEVPADMPQTLYFAERWAELRVKLRYFFKAQLVPVQTDLLNNEWGKCKLRDRQRVHLSPVRPIVHDPQFNVPVQFNKKVGLIGGKMCNMDLTFSKNFYLAGEMAYFSVNIDNSKCSDACSLQIAHVSKVKLYQNWRKYSVSRTHHKENFFLCGPGESKQLILQFQIASKRRSPPGTGFFGKHASDYHHVSTLVPESVFAQTFSVQNYLEVYLTHDGTVFSNDSTKKFHFQLIQPSLVPGILAPPPPIFMDTMGNILNMENPVIEAPQGQIIQGEAMEINEKVDKKDKEVQDEEPTVGPATNQ